MSLKSIVVNGYHSLPLRVSDGFIFRGRSVEGVMQCVTEATVEMLMEVEMNYIVHAAHIQSISTCFRNYTVFCER